MAKTVYARAGGGNWNADATWSTSSGGAADTINWNLGNKQKATLTDDGEIEFTAPAGPTNLVLKCINFGAFTITFPATMRWAGGTEPTWTEPDSGEDRIDILCMYYDGSVYHGTTMLDSKAAA